jgi:hypothetical protein
LTAKVNTLAAYANAARANRGRLRAVRRSIRQRFCWRLKEMIMRRVTCYLLALSLGACAGAPPSPVADQQGDCVRLAIDAAGTTPRLFNKKNDTGSMINGVVSSANIVKKAVDKECLK